MHTIKEWLFQTLFPNEAQRRTELIMSTKTLSNNVALLNQQIGELKIQRQPSIADLMRESLAVIRLDLGNLDQSGDPRHYTYGLSKEGKHAMYASLSSVFANNEFQKVSRWLINMQANLTVRKGLTDRQNDAGRFTINGISLILSELKKANALYEEAVKPPDQFNPHEVD